MKRLLLAAPLLLCLVWARALRLSPSEAPVQEAPTRMELVRVALAAPEPSPAPTPEAAPSLEAEPVYLTVYEKETGRTGEMELEDYIYHVLAGEMPASYPLEALKAQAVAARSYALWKSGLFGGGCGRGGDADVCTDSGHCMAYASDEKLQKNWGGEYETNREKLQRAVAETAGLVCAYDGEPIQALFHAVSGGRTEDAAAVFQNALPYLVSVESAGEEDAGRFSADVTYSREELARRLNAAFPGAGLTARTLESKLRVVSRTESGRAETVLIGNREATGREVRKALDLDSANLTFCFEGDSVCIHTQGFGHGVGLSQAGAEAMAQDGAGYEEILTHYYSGVEICPLAALLEGTPGGQGEG